MTLIAGHTVDVKDANQAVYNGFDNCVTFEVDEARQSLRQNDTLIYDFERGMQAVALEMMLRGFRVDIAEREQVIALTKTRREAADRILSAIVEAIIGKYDRKLPNSQKQLQHLFYDVMKLRPIERFINGAVKRPITRETLEKLETQSAPASLIINAILFHRDLTKSLQVLETEIDSDWRWRCSYNIGGTSTGRWSSSKSPFIHFNEESLAWIQSGNNLQNITEELRRIFVPDPRHKLFGIDKAQSESHDVGWFCGTILGDWSYLDACESGDLHTYITRLLYPEWSWTGNLAQDRQIAERRCYRFFTYRDISKRLGHASNYLGGPQEISKKIRLPLTLVKEFQERYFDAFPCIQTMHSWVARQLQTERYLVNSFGRRRDFFDRPDSNDTLKAGVAYLFQSATGDCLNLGLWRLWKRMGTRIQLLAQLHDAVYFQIRETTPERERDLLREALDCVQITQTDPKSGRKMTIPGEIVGGYNWAHRYRILKDGTKDDWNPRGLNKIAA